MPRGESIHIGVNRPGGPCRYPPLHYSETNAWRMGTLAALTELARREPPAALTAAFATAERGWQRLYIDHVLQANTGADLDFLAGASGSEVTRDSH